MPIRIYLTTKEDILRFLLTGISDSPLFTDVPPSGQDVTYYIRESRLKLLARRNYPCIDDLEFEGGRHDITGCARSVALENYPLLSKAKGCSSPCHLPQHHDLLQVEEQPLLLNGHHQYSVYVFQNSTVPECTSAEDFDCHRLIAWDLSPLLGKHLQKR